MALERGSFTLSVESKLRTSENPEPVVCIYALIFIFFTSHLQLQTLMYSQYTAVLLCANLALTAEKLAISIKMACDIFHNIQLK